MGSLLGPKGLAALRLILRATCGTTVIVALEQEGFRCINQCNIFQETSTQEDGIVEITSIIEREFRLVDTPILTNAQPHHITRRGV